MLSNSAEYALKAALYIAGSPDAPVRATEASENLGIPRNYLSKILHELARAGVLGSTRGRTGGFILARPADEIPLIEVVNRFDSIGRTQGLCLMKSTSCNENQPCAAHDRWAAVQDAVLKFFTETTLADLKGPSHSPGLVKLK